MVGICIRSPLYLFCLYNLFNKYYANNTFVTRKLRSFTYDINLRVTMQYKLTVIRPIE